MPWTFYNSSGEALTNFGPTVLTDIDVANGSDVGAVLAAGDEILIYDTSASANKKSDVSRIATYVDSNASGSAKAWIQIAADGSETELAAYNCAQTDTNTGIRDITFTVGFASTAYVAVGSAGTPAGSELQAPIFGENVFTADACQVLMRQAGGSSNVDVKTHAAFFGDQ